MEAYLIMMNDAILAAAIEVLKEPTLYSHPNRKEQCFLSVYQIAVLVKEKLGLRDPVGGDEQAPHRLSRDIAHKLSTMADNGEPIERAFFSTKGLDKGGFQFDGESVPSSSSFSMFRWIG